MGGGFDVIEGSSGNSLIEVWPTKIAWFRHKHHAQLFLRKYREAFTRVPDIHEN